MHWLPTSVRLSVVRPVSYLRNQAAVAKWLSRLIQVLSTNSSDECYQLATVAVCWQHLWRDVGPVQEIHALSLSGSLSI